MKNKILIYDDNCPLCTWYSGLFVKLGFLHEEGRKAFSTLDPSLLQKINFDRGKNEIPLLDLKTSKVQYGIDALLEILDQKIPYIKAIGNFKPIKWFLIKLYKLISFNRKVIVAKKCGVGNIDCAPDINYRYRFLFLAVSLLFNTIMLFPVHDYLFMNLSYYHLTISELQAAHFIFVLMNGLLAITFRREKGIEYLGQVNMLALSAILLLIPLIGINLVISNNWINSIFLVTISAFIFKEYFRRMEYAGILLEYKWVTSTNLLCLNGFILYLFH